eukprot:TRINITY_DN21407_c0_g1_i1.p1 TRINITY_DN21407_c0_g1~~TRINITY_DN21407_c0_g1_i1.p1  ORF type:complete len:109 (+),score=1.86 TRINITY_DN21407_c0_g1_i1:648-974(+)
MTASSLQTPPLIFSPRSPSLVNYVAGARVVYMIGVLLSITISGSLSHCEFNTPVQPPLLFRPRKGVGQERGKGNIKSGLAVVSCKVWQPCSQPGPGQASPAQTACRDG